MKSISVFFALALAVVSLESRAFADLLLLPTCGDIGDCQLCLDTELSESGNKKSDCGWFLRNDGTSECLDRRDCKDEDGGVCVQGRRDKPTKNRKRCEEAGASRNPPEDACESNGSCKSCLRSKFGERCAYWTSPDRKEERCIEERSCDDGEFRGGVCTTPIEGSSDKKVCRKALNAPLEPVKGVCFPYLVGEPVDDAIAFVKNLYGKNAKIVVVRPGDFCCTKDLRVDRLRIFVDEDDIVTAGVFTPEPCFG